jgi:hypothetical protein
MNGIWIDIRTVNSKNYICGYCNKDINSEKGYHFRSDENGLTRPLIYICHNCQRPTFFDLNNNQYPGHKIGEEIKNIDDDKIKILYNELRNAFSVNAFTATILCCRKLLMHIAVSKGADPGKNFIEYVEYLSSKNYIPPESKDWVDHIREKGNEANHEIVIMEEEDAKDLISFTEMLLKIIYDFPARIKNIKAIKKPEE